MAERGIRLSGIYQGQAANLQVTVKGSGSIAGWNTSMAVKKQKSDPSALFTQAGTVVDPTNRILSFPLTAAQTKPLVPGTYVADFWRTDSGSEEPIDDGTLTISEPVRVLP